jgi:hypothetical protein
MGGHPFGKLADLLDREAREERAEAKVAELAAFKAMEAEALEGQRKALEMFRDVEALADAVMVMSGHHKHRRQWRKRRRKAVNGLLTTTQATAPAPAPGSLDELKALAERAIAGDTSALPVLRKALASGPEIIRKRGWFMHRYGDPYDLLEFYALERTYGEGAEVKKEAIRMEMAEKRKELEGDSPTLIEKLLVERVVFSWWEVTIWQTVQAINPKAPYKDQVFFLKLIDAAHGRLMKATTTLARVRRMAVPALKVTVNQQNVGGHIAAPIVPRLTSSDALVRAAPASSVRGRRPDHAESQSDPRPE